MQAHALMQAEACEQKCQAKAHMPSHPLQSNMRVFAYDTHKYYFVNGAHKHKPADARMQTQEQCHTCTAFF